MDEPDVDALLSEAETAQIDFENGKLVFVTYEGALWRAKGHCWCLMIKAFFASGN